MMKRRQDMTRFLVAVGSVLILASLFASEAIGDQSEKRPFHYSCVIFDRKDNQTVFKGVLDMQRFQKWFKEDYGVGGERVETPKDATVFGVLVLTDGEETLVMPLYTWGNDKGRYFACQSHTIGRAPMFGVLADTQKNLIDRMKSELSRTD
jgi:hypothetical protein